MIDVCTHDLQTQLIVFGAFFILEYYLGKTKKVESGSSLELILTGVWGVLKAIFKRRSL